MALSKSTFSNNAIDYLRRLNSIFTEDIIKLTELLAQDLLSAWQQKQQVFICGNGGSGANAIHIANDFHYGIGACGPPPKQLGLRVEALCANQGVITCLANDTGYENIYSNQLQVKGNQGDLLIVLSGSGNSTNVINAIKTAKLIGLKSYAILAYDGGECKNLADHSIHFPIDDMQIAEDTQIIISHICMQWLSSNKPLAN